MHRLVLLALMMASSAAASVVEHAVGIARDTQTRDVRYIEHHQYTPDGRHLIHYYTPEMELVAYKRLRYPGLPQHPTIEQEDFTRESYARVDVTDDEIVMLRRSGDRTTAGALPIDENLVVDAGFDAYIKAYWAQLATGSSRKLDFAVAGVPRSLAMRVEKTATMANGNVAFRIYPGNVLIRMFVPAIELTYSADRRLVEYTGFSNIVPPSGENRSVSIVFDHHVTAQPVEKPLARWLAAAVNPGTGGHAE